MESEVDRLLSTSEFPVTIENERGEVCTYMPLPKDMRDSIAERRRRLAMAEWNVADKVTLRLRLAVAKEKYEQIRSAADCLVDEVLGEHSNRDPITAAKRLKLILQELENYAPNLHK